MNLQLPGYELLGDVRRWYLPLPRTSHSDQRVHEPSGAGGSTTGANDDDDVDVEYRQTTARFIGFGSSWTDNHWGHREEWVPAGSRCNACRWFELRIFREFGDFTLPAGTSPSRLREAYVEAAETDKLGDYVVYKAGMSIVPGEVPYVRYDVISSPHEVVEALTTRKVTDNGPVAFITKPSALALASGARFDEELEDAYVNRAVS
jgi:hypothetical protein